jgi:ATP synthase F0 subunit b
MEALGINPGLLVVQVIAFIIVFLTLQAWVYRPLLSMLESRKQKIGQGLEDARVAAEARADAEKEAARILAEAHGEASKVVRDATDRAATAAREARSTAEAEANTARQAIVAEAQQERNRILGDLRGQVAALAIAATHKLVGETLDPYPLAAGGQQLFVGDIRGEKGISRLGATVFPEHTRAFLKIQDGCNAFCNYCIVPHARGRSRSLPPEEVAERSKVVHNVVLRECVNSTAAVPP